LKRYFRDFLDLPFEAEPGSESLLSAAELARELQHRKSKDLPPDTPTEFVPGSWRKALTQKGMIDRQLWETALAFAMRDALRSGGLYLAHSRQHVSFWNLVYDQERWEQEREHAYAQLALPTEADRALSRLRQELDEAAWDLRENLPRNNFANIQDGKLKLKRRDAAETPEGIQELRRLIHTQLPRVRIEDLLLTVDTWCGFSREFRPLSQKAVPPGELVPALFAALVAHGTNLGIAMMAQSTDGITIDMLQNVSRWYLRQETLRAANRVLVDYHHRLELSSVWGSGIASSSDGQRFRVEASSLLGSFYPRYFGFHDRAVTLYTHVSDQYSVFASRVISCSPREAIYVLDGLLENDTILRPREHFTDTHGFTEQLFGLCYLLGYSFMPRLKDLKDQQLYKLDRATSYGPLDALFHGTLDAGLVRIHWDQLVRIAASLRMRTAPAHVILERLAPSTRSDSLAKAVTTLGRIVKTVYVLRYLHDEELRRRVQLQLNRGESRHGLAKRLFFANQGAFRTGDYDRDDEQGERAEPSLQCRARLQYCPVR
jgi:TnpA family transposase